MDNRVGVGIFVGLIFTSTIYVIQSDSFTRTQKIILLIFTICFPVQWIGILICLIYNSYKDNNTEDKTSDRKIQQKTITLNSQIENLNDLKEKGILTEEEYNQKVSRIEKEKTEEYIKKSQEYKQLKSLLDSDVLTKEEFESKIILIKNVTNQIFYVINLVAYTKNSLKTCIKNDSLKLYRNTIVTLQDGTVKTLENVHELKKIIEILKNKE